MASFLFRFHQFFNLTKIYLIKKCLFNNDSLLIASSDMFEILHNAKSNVHHLKKDDDLL